MGLDNGISVKNVNVAECPLAFVRHRLEDTYGDCLPDIVYWRKHWGLRNDVLNILHSEGDGDVKLDIEDIPAIVKIITKYLNEDFWNENSNSIWEFEDAMNWLPYDIIALCWLEEYWKEHPEVEVYFYDSY